MKTDFVELVTHDAHKAPQGNWGTTGPGDLLFAATRGNKLACLVEQDGSHRY